MVQRKLTLKLDIGREGCKIRGTERSLLGYMVIGQRAGLGESGQIEGRQDWIAGSADAKIWVWARRTLQYHNFVGGIDVQTPPIKWERDGVVVQCAISACIVLLSRPRSGIRSLEEVLLELTTGIGVRVSLATSSWTYPIPRIFPKGDPKAESYQK